VLRRPLCDGQRRPSRKLLRKADFPSDEVVGLGDARQRHVHLTRPFAGTKQHPRATARAKAPFRILGGSIPAKRRFAVVDLKLRLSHAYPTDSRGAMGTAARLAHTITHEPRRPRKRELNRSAHARPFVFHDHVPSSTFRPTPIRSTQSPAMKRRLALLQKRSARLLGILTRKSHADVRDLVTQLGLQIRRLVRFGDAALQQPQRDR
jgi:hypothetical protein